MYLIITLRDGRAIATKMVADYATAVAEKYEIECFGNEVKIFSYEKQSNVLEGNFQCKQ